MERLLRGHSRRSQQQLHRRGRSESNPSFSSSLLDAIFHSIDAEDTTATAAAIATKPNQSPQPRTSLDLIPSAIKKPNLSSVSSLSSASSASTAGFLSASTSTSSSEADSITSKKGTQKTTTKKKKPSCGALRGRFRRAQQTPKPETTPAKTQQHVQRPPSSPGARLASFLNSILMYAAIRKKAKVSATANASILTASSSTPASCGNGRRGEESARSSTSSSTCRRSCLSKTPAAMRRRERSVRFCPVSVVVGEDCRPCGQRRLPACGEVEEMLRRAAAAMAAAEEEEEEVGSESSSDLFELEDLSVGINGGELPVYGTTHLATIAQGFV